MNIIQKISIGKFEITVANELRDDELALLKRTVIGNPGGFRYALRGVQKQIMSYGDNIFFITGRRQSRLVGIIAFCKRTIFTRGKAHPSFYVRYFSIDTPYQRKLVGQEKETRKNRRPVREGSIKEKILEVLTNPEVLKLLEPGENHQYLLYNCLEAYNQRSENIIRKAGYEHIRSAATFPFSRINPRKHEGFDRAKPWEKEIVEKLLCDFYKPCSLYTLDYANGKGQYFVMRKNGAITAAVNAQAGTLYVVELPELWGWFMFKVIGRLPVMRRIFSPGTLHFVGMDALYYKPGHVADLVKLMESVLAEFKRNVSLSWIDIDSSIYRDLKNHGHLGILNTVFKGKPVKIYARFSNYSEEEKDVFRNTPAYLTSIDLS